MGKFTKGKGKEMPAISTASLPDIIFMLLFFFMVATTLKEVDVYVQYKLPEAVAIEKIENKRLISYIWVGKNGKIMAAGEPGPRGFSPDALEAVLRRL